MAEATPHFQEGSVFDPYQKLLSIHVPVSIYQHPTLSDFAKLLYGRLALHKGKPKKNGDSGHCFAGVPKLASDSGKSVAAVKRALKELSDAGLIQRVRHKQEVAETQFLWHSLLASSLLKQQPQDGSKVSGLEPDQDSSEMSHLESSPKNQDGSKVSLKMAQICAQDGSIMSHHYKEEKIQEVDSRSKDSNGDLEMAARFPQAETGAPVSSPIASKRIIENLRAYLGKSPTDPFVARLVSETREAAGTHVTEDQIADKIQTLRDEGYTKGKTWAYIAKSLKDRFCQDRAQREAFSQEGKNHSGDLPVTQTPTEVQAYAPNFLDPGAEFDDPDDIPIAMVQRGAAGTEARIHAGAAAERYRRQGDDWEVLLREQSPAMRSWMKIEGAFEFMKIGTEPEYRDSMLAQIAAGQHPKQKPKTPPLFPPSATTNGKRR
jgi:hypothetical protein